MGCLKFKIEFRFWRRKSVVDTTDKKEVQSRPLHDSVISTDSAFYDLEKTHIVTAHTTSSDRKAPLPSDIAKLRPRAHPTYSAYSGATRRYNGNAASTDTLGDDDDDDNDDDDDGDKPKASCTWTGSHSSTQVSEASTNDDSKLKEDAVDDPAEKERQRKADVARRKAEREEKERVDFLQMM